MRRTGSGGRRQPLRGPGSDTRSNTVPATGQNLGSDLADRLILSMEPGKWYGRGDLIQMADLTRSDRIKVDQVLLRYGLVQRARNPEWQGTCDGKMTKASDALEPMWLYRMTSRGEAYCELLRMVCD